MFTGHPQFDWKISDIERKADEANRRLYEIDALRSTVDRLEHSYREACTDINGLRAQLETAQDSIIQLQQQIIELMEPLK
jgi:predicted  nucleic acid-binding Zn-ribbon protein